MKKRIIILGSVVVAVIVLAMYAFTTVLTIVSGFFAFALSFAVVCVWGAIFPFVRREQFENSPIAKHVAGIPLITITGLLGGAFSLFGLYRLTQDEVFTLDRWFAVAGAFAVVAIGAVWYLIATAYRRSQGVDVAARYREIPIE